MEATTRARYDGLADWYDAYNGPAAARNSADLAQLLGPGEGMCLDLGCGTGLYFDTRGRRPGRSARPRRGDQAAVHQRCVRDRGIAVGVH